MPDHDTVLRWSAHEHDNIERGPDWFWALGIVTVCAALTSILFHDTLFALLIVVAAITIVLLVRVPSKLIHFEVSDKGIRTGDILHRYGEIISFWVEDEHDGRPLLLVDTTKFLSPNLIIPIEHIEPSLLRAYLRERAKEVHMKEPVSHKIFEFFGL